MEEIVHFVIDGFTACHQHVIGSTITWFEKGVTDEPTEIVTAGRGYNVQHTCILEYVTCSQCLDSKLFKNMVKEEYE